MGISFFLNYYLIRLLRIGKRALFVNIADVVAKLYNNYGSNPKEEDYIYFATDCSCLSSMKTMMKVATEA